MGSNNTIVLVGLMGAGKTSIARRLSEHIGLPFRDSDAEIELAAGCTIPELFARYGEQEFRDGERRVIRRLLAGEPMVLATGGGAFIDGQTRSLVREKATSVWLRCTLSTLLHRVASRTNRPLLNQGNPESILARLMDERYPVYGEADIIVDCDGDTPDETTEKVLAALAGYCIPRRLPVSLPSSRYDIIVGEGLLARAGALLAPVLPRRRVVVVTDRVVAPLYLQTLLGSLASTGIHASHIVVPDGERAKSYEIYREVVDGLLEAGVERQTAVIALGGGVVGDLAGFAAGTTLRGLPFVQIPTTLLSQVDSSVGGKTGINTQHGKNLLGVFHQPRAVICDTSTLATLPPRELKAGYAEIVKAGLIGDAGFFEWCERHGAGVVSGDKALQAEAILRACAFKASVVGQDEREELPDNGRALLNLGHTFGHALEREIGYGNILHGEAVGVGLGLAFSLSARLGHCNEGDVARVRAHIGNTGLVSDMRMLNRRLSAATLVRHMRRDKKVRDGAMTFVLVRGIGQAFTSRDVPEEAVLDVLRSEGCVA